MQELIKALIKAKAEFNPIQKDGTNPHYKRKYATLDYAQKIHLPHLY